MRKRDQQGVVVDCLATKAGEMKVRVVGEDQRLREGGVVGQRGGRNARASIGTAVPAGGELIEQEGQLGSLVSRTSGLNGQGIAAKVERGLPVARSAGNEQL